ncbi:MAG: ROK family protein [Paracoccaceae bacterium]|jgi:N-acetylglucosamine kinase
MGKAGGIDIGGTKIEASVFDDDWNAIATHRVITPRVSYPALVAAVAEQAKWLDEQSTVKEMPIGIGIPGLHNAQSGFAFTANLPATGHTFRADLNKAIGRDVVFGNDCDLFAFSEAVLGAGKDHETVFGLILGTGIGGGVCYGESLIQTLNSAAGEVGHLSISGALINEFDLPILLCGCGRHGCYETLAAGPGLARLSKLVTGQNLETSDVAAKAAAGDDGAKQVMEIWRRLVAALIGDLQVTIDPDCIVLGGGLSNIPDVADFVADGLPEVLLRESTPPLVVIAKYGDSSGTRGAALAAVMERNKS